VQAKDLKWHALFGFISSPGCLLLNQFVVVWFIAKNNLIGISHASFQTGQYKRAGIASTKERNRIITLTNKLEIY
jgi:hypothetical protein